MNVFIISIISLIFGIITLANWEELEGLIKGVIGTCGLFFTIIGGVGILMSLLVAWGSYDNYIDAKVFFHTTQEQFSSALIIYESSKVLEVSSGTDLVNNNFQESYAGMLKNLRDHIVRYNRVIEEKKILMESWFLRPFIYPPDEDMVPIKLMDIVR